MIAASVTISRKRGGAALTQQRDGEYAGFTSILGAVNASLIAGLEA